VKQEILDEQQQAQPMKYDSEENYLAFIGPDQDEANHSMEDNEALLDEGEEDEEGGGEYGEGEEDENGGGEYGDGCGEDGPRQDGGGDEVGGVAAFEGAEGQGYEEEEVSAVVDPMAEPAEGLCCCV
jgi:hypothetical protein